MDYKETLNLPRTRFPMKADLPKREPLILERWKDLYKKIQEKGEGREVFLLHDGPPYANGNIHIGHALNKILKDIINKYNLMTGKRVIYIPGWDCHGLPIEREVEKNLKKQNVRKEDIPKGEFRKLCREYALKFVRIQREEFKRLGVLGDWDNPYLTMDPNYEAQEIREIGRFFERGAVYRSKKPVYWCIYDTTAEAEAEVEYQEREDPSIYVKFPVEGEEDTYLVIWTTTPWTLPANLGVMVGEDFTYAYVKTEKGTLIVVEDLVDDLLKVSGLEGKVVKRVKGSQIIGLRYKHPFVKKEDMKGYLSEETLKNMWRVFPSEFVDTSTGTGIVHMAPGHGQEDYTVGKRYGLDPYAPVDDRGLFVEPAPDFIRGMRVFDANQVIIERLRESGYLLHEGRITHSYPHCWRCKNPVIFRATPQWFISMEATVDGETIRERSLKEIDRVTWIPEYGRNRIRSMVEVRPDWCISRQRYWGVPIPVFYCKKCGEIAADRDIFEHVANLVASYEFGSDVWFDKDEKDLIPEGYRCRSCGGTEFKKEEDILDVWFDSGCSHAAVVRPMGFEKADLYLEGSDQHRGWFQASLIESVGSYGESPYKAVLTHGFTVDEKGRKMSKSLGNVISPQEIIEKYGADLIRLWVVSEDYTEDVKLGNSILRNLAEDYKKIRNTLRFLLANLYDFDPVKGSVPYSDMHHFDRWVLSRLQHLLEEIHRHYRDYTFHRVYHAVRNFCVTMLSAIYMDVVKDRLYVYPPDSWERRSAQTAMYRVLVSLTTSLAPFLSFTAEEVWEHIREIDPSLPESVFLYEIPLPEKDLMDQELEKDYDLMLKVRSDVFRLIEVARKSGTVGHPYEAKVFLSADEVTMNVIKRYTDYLRYFLTVSQVEFSEGGDIRGEGEEGKGVKIGVSRAEGKTCPRCWIYSPEEEFRGDVCGRCADILERMGYKTT